MTYRKTAFALLVLFALLTPVISAAYVVSGLLLAAWTASLLRERRFPDSLRAPFTFLAGLLALLTAASAIFSRDPSVSVRHLAGLALLLVVPVAMDLVDDSAGRAPCCSPSPGPGRRSRRWGSGSFFTGGTISRTAFAERSPTT